MPLTALRQFTKSLTRDEQDRKQCSTCRAWKPVDQFYATKKGNSDGLMSICSRCDRSARLLRQYGVDADWYDAKLVEQDGGCAICERSPGVTALHIDHDHSCCPTRKKSCGKCLRGLLCEDCNRAIGMLNDSPRLLVNAMSYLS